MKKLILLLLLEVIQSRCVDGCLKCNKGICQFCDLSQGLRLSGGKCEKFSLENCKIFNNLGTCLICHDSFHLDQITRKCIKILETNKIENCLAYSGSQLCQTCQVGFLLSAGKCQKIEKPIENCEIENSQGICLKCSKDHILGVDQKSCLKTPSSEVCSTFTNIQCDSCSDGHLKNQNEYLNQVFSLFTSIQQEQFIMRDQALLKGYKQFRKYNTCISTQVENCLIFEEFNLCRECEEGYFLDENKKCAKYPQDRLPHCQMYSSLTDCYRCVEGFYLNDENRCMEVKKVPHCSKYNKQKNMSNCVQCQEGYFLRGYNSCVIRKVTKIENCVSLHPERERCLECKQSYKPTDDSQVCLAEVKNCSVYQGSNYLSKELLCRVCQEGYYYNVEDNFCTKGTKVNCQLYNRLSNVCQKCLNKFYLQNGECLPHDVLPGCEEYHPTIKNVCWKCNYSSFYFFQQNVCWQVESIENCDVYSSVNGCRKCNDGYFLQDNTCVLIPTQENCLQKKQSLCLKCLKDFVLEGGVCKDPLDYIVNECEVDNVDGTTNYRNQKCFHCKKDRVPLNYKDSYICIEKDYMLFKSGLNALDSQCLQYKFNKDQVYECQKCKYPFVLNEGVCVQSCPADKTLYKQSLVPFNSDGDRVNESFTIEQVNVCGKLIENCAVAAPDLDQPDQSTVKYSCVQCQQGKLSEIDFSKQVVLIKNPFIEQQQYGISPVSHLPSQKCFDLANNIQVLGETNQQTKLINNCDYYLNTGLTKGCTRCSHGHTGVVLNVVNQCKVYENNQFTCKQCNVGYYKSTPYECKAVSEIPFCKTYSQTSTISECIECDSNYYVSNETTCTQRQLSSNKSNCTAVLNADSCTCSEGYFNFGTQNSINCVSKPSNCKTARNNNGSATCDECDRSKSYRVSQGQNHICVAASVDNCQLYKETTPQCEVCSEGYFLNDGTCVQHTGLTNCSTTHPTQKNTCQQCNEAFVNFEMQTRCVSIAKIDNCLTYDTTETCSLCAEGFRLENIRKRCIAIPAETNCLVMKPMNIMDTVEQDNGFIDTYDAMDLTEFIYTCDKCKKGYFRVADASATFTTTTQVVINGQLQNHPRNNETIQNVFICRDFLNAFLDQCAEHNIDGLVDTSEKIECQQCEENYMPEVVTDDRHMCFDRAYVDTKKGNSDDFTNCYRVEYNKNVQQYSCVECMGGFVLEGGECKTVCANNAIHFGVYSTTGGNVTQTVSGACVDDTAYQVTNCKVYSSNLGALNGNPICVQCKAGYVPLIEIDDKTRATSQYNYENSTYDINNPVAKYQKIIACDDYDDTDANQHMLGTLNGSKLVPGCKYYNKILDNPGTYYYCVSCNLTLSGEVKTQATAEGNENPIFIDTCTAITDCDGTSNYNKTGSSFNIVERVVGDTPLWNTYFSCYKCSNNKVPTLHVKIAANNMTGLEPYDPTFADGTNKFSGQTGGALVACRQLYNGDGSVRTDTPPDLTLQNIDANNKLFQTTGCGLAVVNTDSVGDAAVHASDDGAGNPWGQGIGCVACSPGYRPVRITAPTDAKWAPIDSCVAIENCTSGGNFFNGCENCIHLFEFDELANSKISINYQYCVAPRENVSATNCYAAANGGPCQICKRGYEKNDQNVCVQVLSPKCSNYSQQRNATLLFGTGIKGTGALIPYLINGEKILGCQQCTNNTDIIAKVNSVDADRDPTLTKTTCTQNPQNPLNTTVDNCQQYGYNGTEVICKKCANGFIITLKNECTAVNNATLQNCSLANEMNGTTCIECSDGFLNVAGLCMDKSNDPIQNCLQYNEQLSKTSTSPYCQKCQDGFYLSPENDFCKEIPLENCAEWGEQQGRTMKDSQGNDVTRIWCLRCSSGFALIEKKGEEQFCYPIAVSATDNQNKCVEWDLSLFTQRKLKCNQCKIEGNEVFIVASTDVSVKSTCMQINSLSTNDLNALNCKDFDTEPNNAPNPYDNASLGTFHENSFNCLACTEQDQVDKYENFFYDANKAECMARNKVNNCLKHFKDKDECSECSENHVLDNNQCLSIKGDPAQVPINKGYIQSCLPMGDCDSQIKYEGLPLHLSSTVSCHKCSSTSKIPFVGLRVDDDFKAVSLQEYSFAQTHFYKGSGKQANLCLNPGQKTDFSIADDNDLDLPANCGVGVINTSQSKSARDASLATLPNPLNTYQLGIYCGACKPKYKPTYTTKNDQRFAYMVSGCAEIANCKASTWFNACSQCNSKHSYKYDKEKGVQFDQCISYTENPNCYAVDNSSTKKCVYCKPGYIKNPDGYCEAITAPRCSQFKFQRRQYFSGKDLAVGLILQGDGIGCQQCDDGFVGLYHKKATLACTASPYHTQKLVLENSKYIYQCENYKVVHGLLKCQKCVSDAVLSISGKCLAKTNLENCVLAVDSQRCRKCKEGFVVVDRTCVAQNIENCQNYEYDDQSYIQLCTKCQPGYYLFDNKCFQGAVENCRDFQDKQTCLKCNDGYGLVNTEDYQNYCYPIDTSKNCLEVDDQALRVGELSCRKCKDSDFVIVDQREAFMPGVCLEFKQIPNCTRYSKKRNLLDSSFECEKCDNLYYLKDNKCVLRVQLDKQCLEYSPTSDKCTKCAENYFLEGTDCVQYPVGIPNCAVYYSQTQCLVCSTGFFVKNNTCLPVDESVKIENCLLYSDKDLCGQCDLNFLLVGNECVVVEAKDCLTYDSIYSCSSCSEGFGFQQSEDGKFIHCISKSVSNCLVSEDYAPYLCLQCQGDNYPLDGVCTAVVTPVENCIVYDGQDTCAACTVGTALSQDKKKCLNTTEVVSQLDPNCSTSRITEEPSCNTCKDGYVFKNGYCVECVQNTKKQGCQNCDPYDQSKCLLCLSGYYMYDDGLCYKDGTLPPELEPKEETSEDTTPDVSTDESKDTSMVFITALFVNSFFLLY